MTSVICNVTDLRNIRYIDFSNQIKKALSLIGVIGVVLPLIDIV